MMNQAVVFVFAVGVSAGVARGQQIEAGEMPRVVFTLPADVAPQKVEIRYFMRGEFGGYGSFVTTAAKRWNYEIAAGVDGKAAEEIKIVAYMPGCEFEVFDKKVSQPEMEENLQCRPVRMTPMRGADCGFRDFGSEAAFGAGKLCGGVGEPVLRHYGRDGDDNSAGRRRG